MFLGLTGEQWASIGTSLLIVVATAVVVRLLLGYLLDRILKRLLGERGAEISRTLVRPVRWLLTFLAVLISLNIVLQRLDLPFLSDQADFIDNIFFVLYVVTGYLISWRLVVGLAAWYASEIAPRTQSKLDERFVPFGRRVTLIVLTIVMLIILLSHFEVDVSGLVATLGIGSLAIALAAKETLSDTISGFVIMIDQPFRIGDRIEIQDLDTWGDVVDIGLRSSRVRTRDNRLVIVPNSIMSKSLLVNYSYPDPKYRIQIELPISYGSDVDRVRKTIIAAVENVEGVEPDRPVEALLLQFTSLGMVFRVRWWLDSFVDTRRMFDRVNTAIIRALDSAGISIASDAFEVQHLIAESEIRKVAAAFREEN